MISLDIRMLGINILCIKQLQIWHSAAHSISPAQLYNPLSVHMVQPLTTLKYVLYICLISGFLLIQNYGFLVNN